MAGPRDAGAAKSPDSSKAAPDARRLQRRLPGASDLLAAGPTRVVLFALVCQFLPQQPVVVHIDIDFRTAVLLSVAAAIIAHCFLAPRAPPREAEPAKAAAAAEPKKPPQTAPPLPAKVPEVYDLPEDVMRTFLVWRDEPSDLGTRRRLECPVCHDVMLNPRRTSCQHHACAYCLEQMQSNSLGMCPHCNVPTDLQALQPATAAMREDLATIHCSCSACKAWEGTFADFCVHLPQCSAAQGKISFLQYRHTADGGEHRRQALEATAIDRLYSEMLGASPVLVHRFPSVVIEREAGHWSSPLFSACGHLWSLRMGPLGGAAQGARYFCILPHQHTERLRCSLVFARRPGEGYKERRVHDWPAELAGHPWGPTVPSEEVGQYKQVDGSLLLMIHAAALGADGDKEPGSMEYVAQAALPPDASH